MNLFSHRNKLDPILNSGKFHLKANFTAFRKKFIMTLEKLLESHIEQTTQVLKTIKELNLSEVTAEPQTKELSRKLIYELKVFVLYHNKTLYINEDYFYHELRIGTLADFRDLLYSDMEDRFRETETEGIDFETWLESEFANHLRLATFDEIIKYKRI